jgi:hypothetical protein
LNTQRSWLVVERLPAYAPELNPAEGLWSSLKAVELANLATPTLGEVHRNLVAEPHRAGVGRRGPGPQRRAQGVEQRQLRQRVPTR